MRILIVADVYPPEVSSAANLMRELAVGLMKLGNDVTVVTSYPKYYLDAESEEKTFPEYTTEDGVSVIRVHVLPHHRVNFFVRGIAQLLLPFLFLRKVNQYMRVGVDAVVVYSPPLPLALLGGMIQRRYGAKFLLNMQDIFPQNAIDLHILTLPPLIWFFEQIEKRVYREADVITFHSEGGARFLMDKKQVPPSKIVTVPNWVDIEAHKSVLLSHEWREKWGLEKKFIFLFAGVFGPAQGLELLVNVAYELRDNPHVAFLLVGGGNEKEKLEQIVSMRGITNVIIKPFVPQRDYASLVAECDVGVVCLSAQNKTPFVPGKLSGYMASGKPVIALLNKESDGFEVIHTAQCGYAIEAKDASDAAPLFKKMYAERDTLSTLGENGLRYARTHFSREVCVKTIETLLRKEK